MAGGVVFRGSGRGGTAADGAGNVEAVAVRTVLESPARCRHATRSTRYPCGWRPADRRPRLIPYPSLYNLPTKKKNKSFNFFVKNVYAAYH